MLEGKEHLTTVLEVLIRKITINSGPSDNCCHFKFLLWFQAVKLCRSSSDSMLFECQFLVTSYELQVNVGKKE